MMCLLSTATGSSGAPSVSPATSAAFSYKSLDSSTSESDSSEESSNSSTRSNSKSPPQLSPQNPIYVDLQPNHYDHKDSLLMMTSPQMALLTPQMKNNEIMKEINNKYPCITVKVIDCGEHFIILSWLILRAMSKKLHKNKKGWCLSLVHL